MDSERTAFGFGIEARRGRARAGAMTTSHGPVPTPCFMPVATQATVKGMTPAMLFQTGTWMIVSNTYHLAISPGPDLIRDAGGLHGFMAWDRSILTDSGGFQVYSLAKLRKVMPDGVQFQSHRDGSVHFFTPERVLDLQETFGSDIRMTLDEPSPYPVGRDDAARAVDLTLSWAERSARYFRENGHSGALFTIVQGSIYPDLREHCARALVEIGFDGYAAGGLALGETREERNAVLELLDSILPEDKPRYVMGVGYPEDIADAVERGFDLFDCVLPTRNARKGQVFTRHGQINLRNSRFKDDHEPIDTGCDCYVCRNFSRAYLRHLFLSDEILGPVLATLHSVYYYQSFVRNIRNAIIRGGPA
ncbi:MAG: tRNA guanosine(34) transglycosylase Tgt [candidate division WOR-3 bacterium]